MRYLVPEKRKSGLHFPNPPDPSEWKGDKGGSSGYQVPTQTHKKVPNIHQFCLQITVSKNVSDTLGVGGWGGDIFIFYEKIIWGKPILKFKFRLILG